MTDLARACGFRTFGVTIANPTMHLADALDLARMAEKAGFGILAVGDAFGDSFATLGAVSTVTEKPELFAAIATWTRTPVMTAFSSNTLTELSGGRFRLGFGAMPRDWSEQWHRVDYAKPVDRMRDYVAAIRTARAAKPGSPVDHHGPFYQFENYAPLTEQSSPAPIYLGVTLPKMCALAGEVAEGVIFNGVHTARWLHEVSLPALDEGARRAGRKRSDLDIAQLIFCAIADDERTAFDLARPAVAFYFGIPYMQSLLRHHGWDRQLERGLAALNKGDFTGAFAEVSDEMVDAITIAGTPAQVRDKVRRYAGLVDWLQITPPIGQPGPMIRTLTERIITTFTDF